METKYHPNGAIASVKYNVNGRLHRDNGPAYQRWNNTGVLIQEAWWRYDAYHRDDGPAYQQWNSNGILVWESWYQNGLLHRDNNSNYLAEKNGPAYQRWNDAGELIRELWYHHGRKLTLREIEKILRPENIMTTLYENLPQPIFEEIAGVYRAI